MIIYEYDACTGCEECWEVCPRDVWRINTKERKAEPVHSKRCLDCGACEFQCVPRAIRIERTLLPKAPVVIRDE